MLRLADNDNGGIHRQNVGAGPETANLTTTNRRDERIVTESFAGMNVGKVYLDGWNSYRGDRISEGDTGMGISRSVDYDGIRPTSRLLNPSHQFAFQV